MKDIRHYSASDRVTVKDNRLLRNRIVLDETISAKPIKPTSQNNHSVTKLEYVLSAEPSVPATNDIASQGEFKVTISLTNSLLPDTNGSWKSSTRRRPGWRKVMMISIVFMILTLICNSFVLIWSITRPSGSFNGSTLLFKGDCSRAASIDTWTHVGINVLSTIILAGGSYASQLLVAPTREAIDKAHGLGQSLNVGCSGLTNWLFIGWGHRFLLSVLLLTTIPIHVMYNSVVFSTTSSIDVWSFLVTYNYLTASHHYTTGQTQQIINLEMVSRMVGDTSSLVNLTAQECWNTFSVNTVQDYSGYLKFTNASSSNSSIPILAFCLDTACSLAGQPQSQPWTFTFQDATNRLELLYCLAVRNEPACTVEMIPKMLAAIVACNIVKIAVLIGLFFLPIDPLRTVGDVIASFMESPDLFTRGLGAVSALDFLSKKQDRCKRRLWRSIARRYFHGASRRRWLLTVLLGAFIWLLGFTLGEITLETQYEVSLSKQWQDGFGSLQTSFESHFSFDITSGILVVNLPQLYLSFVYILFNALATSILLSKEWISYSYIRKGLRVTSPIGEQRSTYFLSLPYRYSVPLAALTVVLHWLLSQTLYLATLNQYWTNPDTGEFEFKDLSYKVAYSNLSLIVLLGVGGIFVVGMMLFGCFKYKSGMPIARSDTRAISAACHPIRGHGDPTKKIQYGVIARLGQGRYHVGFSSGPVTPLISGQYYE